MASKITRLGFSPFALGVSTQRAKERSLRGLGQTFDTNSASAAAVRRAAGASLVQTIDWGGSGGEGEEKWWEKTEVKIGAVVVGAALVSVLLFT